MTRWLAWLCLSAAASQAAFAALRVLITYRALDLHLGVVAIGAVAALSAFLPALVALPVGRLVDTGRSRLVMVLGLHGTVLGGLAVATANGVFLLVVGSVLVGLGSVVGAVAGQGYASLASRPEKLDAHFAAWSLSTNVGQVVGLGLVGVASEVLAGGGRDPITTAALLVTGLALCSLPALAGLPRADGFARRDERRLPLAHLLRRRDVPTALSASMVILAGVDLLVVYLPVLAEREGMSVQTVTTLLSVRIGASILARAALPWLLGVVRRDRVLVASTLCSGLALLVLPWVAPSVSLMTGCLVVIGLFWGFGQPMTMTWVVSLVPKTEQGSILATRTLAIGVAMASMPLAAGTVAAVAGVGGVFVLAGGLSLAVSRQTRRSLS